MSAPQHLMVSTGTEEQMPAQLWVPESGRGPGLVLLQEIFGVTEYIRRRAADLADLGYVVLAPELYFRLGATPLEPDTEDVLDKAMGLAGRLDWDQTVADAMASLRLLSLLTQVQGGSGVIGFCFGGGLAFNVAAESDPEVLVAYYGSSLPQLLELAPQVTAPSLHHFGLADSYLPPETVEQIRAAIERPGVQIETYAGAEHAFDGPMPGLHHPEASTEAWAKTTAFLAEHLPIDGHGASEA